MIKCRARRFAIGCIVAVAALLGGCNLGLGSGASGSSSSTTGSTASTQTAIYSVGGSITGLAGSGLMLASGNASVAVAAGATGFTFPTLLANGASYSVSVKTQPQGQTCTVSHGNGTIAQANVTSVQVSCAVDTYTIGGTVSGLNASGLVLANGSSTLNVALGSSAFVFATQVALGASYDVTVQTQPGGGSCTVENATGTMGTGPVTSLQVICGSWTWQSGASRVDATGSDGSQGVPAATNVPGARTPAATWTDASGNLWLFGGQGTGGTLNDLWRYAPATGQWTWMSGSSSTGAAGVYGTQGIAAAGNVPGARIGASSWRDAAGTLWLFGGQGLDASGSSGLLNDLWRFDPTSGQWTWVSGANSVWASGSAPPAGQPGARSGAASWLDGSGNLWLFGGTGTQGLLSDLWQFNPAMGQWTLIGGTPTANNFGVYGTQGKAAASNQPGARTQAAAAIDANGTLWLFGGTGYGALGNSGALNDLWEYSPSTAQWTWVAGWNTPGSAGVYGTSSTAAPTPGARAGSGASADASGDLWLFGGSGYDAQGRQGTLADFWEYDIAARQWIWMGGSQSAGTAGSYGSEGVGDPLNAPGARAQAAAWVDTAGDVWLFGGQGEDGSGASGLLNDLWEFVP